MNKQTKTSILFTGLSGKEPIMGFFKMDPPKSLLCKKGMKANYIATHCSFRWINAKKNIDSRVIFSRSIKFDFGQSTDLANDCWATTTTATAKKAGIVFKLQSCDQQSYVLCYL